jgi:hypothetical protein
LSELSGRQLNVRKLFAAVIPGGPALLECIYPEPESEPFWMPPAYCMPGQAYRIRHDKLRRSLAYAAFLIDDGNNVFIHILRSTKALSSMLKVSL